MWILVAIFVGLGVFIFVLHPITTFISADAKTDQNAAIWILLLMLCLLAAAFMCIWLIAKYMLPLLLTRDRYGKRKTAVSAAKKEEKKDEKSEKPKKSNFWKWVFRLFILWIAWIALRMVVLHFAPPPPPRPPTHPGNNFLHCQQWAPVQNYSTFNYSAHRDDFPEGPPPFKVHLTSGTCVEIILSTEWTGYTVSASEAPADWSQMRCNGSQRPYPAREAWETVDQDFHPGGMGCFDSNLNELSDHFFLTGNRILTFSGTGVRAFRRPLSFNQQLE